MDVKKIRREFPLIEENSKHKQYIYFDNACQSLRPRSVIDAITTYYRDWSACSGRSMHQLSAEVTNRVAAARQSLAKFLNAAKKEEIIFTRNTTEGINLVANSLDLKPGDVVLISDKEHNSNLIPWQMAAKKRGIVLKIIPSTADETFSLANYRGSARWPGQTGFARLDLQPGRRQHPGSGDHQESPPKRRPGAAGCRPGSPAPERSTCAGWMWISWPFSGHKMLGPSGTGVLYGKFSLLEKLEPFLVGGDTVASSTYESCEFLPPPEKFEAGLQDYAGMIGLGAAAQFLMQVGFDAIQKQELVLTQMIMEGIKDLPGLHWIGTPDSKTRRHHHLLL